MLRSAATAPASDMSTFDVPSRVARLSAWLLRSAAMKGFSSCGEISIA
jgi:hypothetical protein